jgi:hypothetical protein
MFSRAVFEPASRLELLLTVPLQYLVTIVYRVFSTLHSHSALPQNQITVVCISDTHTLTCNVPDGDLLIHAGDLTNSGTIEELQAHIDWIDTLPHTHKIVIAGNHDTYLDPRSRVTLSDAGQKGSLDWKSLHYLQHTDLKLTFPGGGDEQPSRTIKIYGAPQIPECGGDEFAFQYPQDQDAWTGTVPDDVDILVTHSPPKFHLDLYSPSLGCRFLLREVWRVKPKLHVFGHIHAAAGQEIVRWDDAQMVYERALGRQSRGALTQFFSLPLWVDAVSIFLYGISGLAWEKIWRGVQRETVLINAALMYQHSGKLSNTVQVVAI